jgi:uncharacterized protein YjbJ (UPF0337 family)
LKGLPKLNGEIKKAWSRLTDDEITLLDGQEDSFYGTREHAREKI